MDSEKTTDWKVLPDTILVLLLIAFFLVVYWTAGKRFVARSGNFVRAVGLGADPFAVTAVMSQHHFSAKYHRSTAHPLFALFTKPLVKLLALRIGRAQAATFMTSLFGAFGLGLFYVLMRRCDLTCLPAFLSSGLLGVTTPHIVFSSFPETYVFAFTSLILMLIAFLFVTGRKPFFFALLATSVYSVGITVINFLLTIVLLAVKYRKERLGRKLMVAASFAVLFAVVFFSFLILQKATYPKSKDFFSKELLHSNMRYVSLTLLNEPVQVMKDRVLNFFVYNVVAPDLVGSRLVFPSGVIHPVTLGSLLLYSVWFISCLVLLYKGRRYREEFFVILFAYFALNFCFYLFYGTETHLYSAHYTFALIAMLVQAHRDTESRPKWIGSVQNGILASMVLLVGINNGLFLQGMILNVRPGH